MKAGDVIKLRDKNGPNAAHEEKTCLYTDKQLNKIENMVYLENYSFRFDDIDQSSFYFNELGLVLDMKDVHKDGNGIDVIWNRFVKILSTSGKIGWVSKNKIERVIKFEI